MARNTRADIVQKLTQAASEAVQSPEFMKRIEKIGAMASYLPPDRFRELIQKDQTTAKEIVGRLGLRGGTTK